MVKEAATTSKVGAGFPSPTSNWSHELGSSCDGQGLEPKWQRSVLVVLLVLLVLVLVLYVLGKKTFGNYTVFLMGRKAFSARRTKLSQRPTMRSDC